MVIQDISQRVSSLKTLVGCRVGSMEVRRRVTVTRSKEYTRVVQTVVTVLGKMLTGAS